LEKTNSIETVTQRHWNGKHGEVWQYRFAQQVPLRNGDDALLVNWLELVMAHEITGQILYQNSFVTNHAITADTVIPLARLDEPAGKSKTRTTTHSKPRAITWNITSGMGNTIWRMFWRP
jgi:hypothetical protein